MVFRYMGTRYPLDQLRHEMDRMVSGFLGSVTDGGWPFSGRSQPAVNMWETADTVFVELEIPGVKNEQVDIAVVGNELSIRVQRSAVEEEGATFHRRERGVGSFARVLRLPAEVDADRVKAELADGVLTVSLPKAEAARPRKIEVATGKVI